MRVPATRAPLAILASFLITTVIGCVDDTVSQESSSLIEYHRSGGFRGVDDRLAIDTDGKATLTRNGATSSITIEASVMNSLRGIMQEIEFGKLEREYQPPGRGADMYEYSITYQGHTVRAKETALPQVLYPIVELLDRILDRG